MTVTIYISKSRKFQEPHPNHYTDTVLVCGFDTHNDPSTLLNVELKSVIFILQIDSYHLQKQMAEVSRTTPYVRDDLVQPPSHSSIAFYAYPHNVASGDFYAAYVVILPTVSRYRSKPTTCFNDIHDITWFCLG